MIIQLTLSARADLDTSWVTKNPLVLAEAKAMTKRLERQITVYSWVPRKDIVDKKQGLSFPLTGPVNPADAGAKSLAEGDVTERMKRYWDLTTPVSGRAADGGAMAPNGIYVATEPVISRSYGGPDAWAMFQMELPKDMIFIDGRYRTPSLGSHLLQALKEKGCTDPLPVDPKDPVFAARNLIKSDTKQMACRQALVDITEAVDAKAVLYIFKAEPVPYCEKVYPWNAAFVLVKPESIVPDSLKVMVRDAPKSSDGMDDLRSILNGVYKYSGLQPLFDKIAPQSEQETNTFMENNYFACNPKIHEQ